MRLQQQEHADASARVSACGMGLVGLVRCGPRMLGGSNVWACAGIVGDNGSICAGHAQHGRMQGLASL